MPQSLYDAAKTDGSETDRAKPDDTKPDDTKTDVTKTDDTKPDDAATDPDAPAFDLVRIDPDGQAVLAGHAAPKTDVDILLDGEVIETVTTDGDGNFVAILETDLSGQARNLQLRAAIPVEELDVARAAPAGLGGPVIRDGGDLSGGAISEGSSGDIARADDTSTVTAPKVPDAATDLAPRQDTGLPRQAEPAEPTPAAPGELAATTTSAAPEDLRAGGTDRPVAGERADPAATTGGELVATDVRAPTTVAGNRYRTSAPVIILPSNKTGDAPTVLSATPEDLKIIQPSVTDINAVVLDRISYGQTGDVQLQGRGKIGRAVRVYGNGILVGTTRIAQDGTWRLSVPQDVGQEIRLLRMDEIDKTGRVTTRIEAPFEYSRSSPKIVRERRVVIQKGDVLWRIAEQHYGEGLRYSLIYGANASLIRDPDLIYPGQEFTIPELIDADQ